MVEIAVFLIKTIVGWIAIVIVIAGLSSYGSKPKKQ
jgi:hypothetical protein